MELPAAQWCYGLDDVVDVLGFLMRWGLGCSGHVGIAGAIVHLYECVIYSYIYIMPWQKDL